MEIFHLMLTCHISIYSTEQLGYTLLISGVSLILTFKETCLFAHTYSILM